MSEHRAQMMPGTRTRLVHLVGLALVGFAGLLFFLSPSPSLASTCVFSSNDVNANNIFADKNNWTSCGSAVPGSGDTAVIPSGTTTNIGANITVSNLFVTGTVNVATTTLTVSNLTTIDTGGKVTSTSGTMTFNGAVSSTGAIGTTNGTSTFASTFQNNSAGGFDIGQGSATFTGNIVNNGTFNLHPGSIFSVSGNVTTSSGATVNIYGGVVRFSGNANQTVQGWSYVNLEMDKSGGNTTTLSGLATVSGYFSATGTGQGGALQADTPGLLIANYANVGGNIQVTSTSGNITFAAGVTSSGTIGTNTGSIFFASTLNNNGVLFVGSGSSTVLTAFNSTGTISLVTSGNFYLPARFQNDGTLNVGAGSVTTVSALVNTGTINNGINGRLALMSNYSTATSATFNGQSGTVRLAGSGAQSIQGSSFNNLEMDRSGGVTSTFSGLATVAGYFSATGTGQGGGLQADTVGLVVSGYATINNLMQVTSTSGTITFNGAVSSSGAIGSTSGNMAMASTFQNNTQGVLELSSGSVTATGNVTSYGTINGRTGRLIFAAGYSTGTGAVFSSGSGTVRLAGSSTQAIQGSSFNNLEMDRSGGVTSTFSGLATVAGYFSATGTGQGGGLQADTVGLVITGYANVGGNIQVTSTSGALTFNGSVSSSGAIGSTSGNISFNGASATLQNNGVLELGASTGNQINTNATSTGVMNTHSGYLVLGGNFNNLGTYNIGATSTVTLTANSGVNQLLNGLTNFNNVVVADSAGNATSTFGSNVTMGALVMAGGDLRLNASNLTVSGLTNVTALSGNSSVSSTSGNLTFTGNATSIGAIGSISGNILFSGIFQNNGTFQVGTGTATATGALTNAGTINGNGGTLALMSSWSNPGTFTAATGTVIFNGASAQTIPAIAPNNLTISNTGAQVSLSTTTTVNGTLTVNPGANLNINNYTLTVPGNILNTGLITVGTSGGMIVHQSRANFTNSAGVAVASYTEGDSVYLTIYDQDRNLNGAAISSFPMTITVNAAGGGDRETITLTETSAGSGIFRNTTGLRLTFRDVSLNDGVLEAKNGGSMSATYTDTAETSDTSSDSKTFSMTSASAGSSSGGGIPSGGGSSGGGGGGTPAPSPTPVAPVTTTPAPAAPAPTPTAPPATGTTTFPAFPTTASNPTAPAAETPSDLILSFAPGADNVYPGKTLKYNYSYTNSGDKTQKFIIERELQTLKGKRVTIAIGTVLLKPQQTYKKTVTTTMPSTKWYGTDRILVRIRNASTKKLVAQASHDVKVLKAAPAKKTPPKAKAKGKVKKSKKK